MTNDLVAYEELLKFKTGMSSSEVFRFLNHVKSQIAVNCNCREDEIFLDLKRDENNDPDALSQRYIIYAKHASEEITNFMKSNGPFSIYVRM